MKWGNIIKSLITMHAISTQHIFAALNYFYCCRMIFCIAFHNCYPPASHSPPEYESFLSCIIWNGSCGPWWLWVTFSEAPSNSDKYHYPKCPYILEADGRTLYHEKLRLSGSFLARLLWYPAIWGWSWPSYYSRPIIAKPQSTIIPAFQSQETQLWKQTML